MESVLGSCGRQALLKPFDFSIKKKIKKEGRQTAALGVAPADTAWRPVSFLLLLGGQGYVGTAVGLWSRIALIVYPAWGSLAKGVFLSYLFLWRLEGNYFPRQKSCFGLCKPLCSTT